MFGKRKYADRRMLCPGLSKTRRSFFKFSDGLPTAGQFILATWPAVVILIGFAVITGDQSYDKCVGS